MTDSKMKHLEFIQNNIHRYAWHSVAVKAMSVLLVALMLMSMILSGKSSAGGDLALASAAVIAFVLWLVDGHYNHMQTQYVDLYGKAHKSTEDIGQMQVHVGDSLNVAAIWRLPIISFHAAVILVVAIIPIFIAR